MPLAFPPTATVTRLLVPLALLLALPAAAFGQTCWSYVNESLPLSIDIDGDGFADIEAGFPIECVEQGDLTTSCGWGETGANGNVQEDCHEDGVLDDCCTSIPGTAGSQTVREMHTQWHACFGAVGDLVDGSNPPNRGNRWYAFHRQIEHDYNLWRESGNWCDPTAALPQGCKIESLQWCPDMQLPYGFSCNLAAPAGCGDAGSRAANAVCSSCQAFPQCLYRGGAGPSDCPSAPDPDCEVATGFGLTLDFPPGCGSDPTTDCYTELEEFPNVEEITTLLDASFHGAMHGAVGDAGACKDINDPNCSVRDPMFWRLHKAIDDVVREWQNANATDVMLVVDRSGSMNGTDATGTTKLDAALEAADIFADLLDHSRSDGQVNRLGVVSYASNAADASRNLSPVDVDDTLRDPGGPFPGVLDAIDTAGGGGCTSIGGGVETALAEICSGGDCSTLTAAPPAGENRRKAVLLLTDGVENVEPCLQTAGASGSTCGGLCFGGELDRAKMYDAQICAVGFGDSGSLNGDLLTVFAESQGGIYMQNPAEDPDGEWIDLKDFFVKCFGQLTDEFLALDPTGFLAATDPVSTPFEYGSCWDQQMTFVSGWKTDIEPGELRLLVNSPAGDLVLAADPAVRRSTQETWDFLRIRQPYRGEASGTWRAQLVRPHRSFVNGFATDSFVSPREGIELVRTQIQRLCPNGCKRVLYFEDETLGESAYRGALDLESAAGLLGAIEVAADAGELAKRLREDWDLLVYAHQGPGGSEPYDGLLTERLCGGLPAILTDTRGDTAAAILKCAGAAPDGSEDHDALITGAAFGSRTLKLDNPGHPVASYGVTPLGTVEQASFLRHGAAIVTQAQRGEPQKWFADVLVRGLVRLEPHKPVSYPRTGDDLLPTVRIAPLSNVAGGYDKVEARVEITRPVIGVGTLITRAKLREPIQMGEEYLDARAATLHALDQQTDGPIIPTITESYPLYDDGTHGDLVAGNLYWSAQLPGLATADGMYQYRFILDLEKDGCTSRREAVQSVFVEVNVDPRASGVDIVPGADPGHYMVTITPRDALGNVWGAGRPGTVRCGPVGSCSCDGDVVDYGNGSYGIDVKVAQPGAACSLSGFGARFQLPVGEEAGTCVDLVEALRAAKIQDPQLNARLLAVTGETCERTLLARTDAAVELAEVLHELEAHAGDLEPGTALALRARLAAFAEESGIRLAEPSHHVD